MTEISFHFNVPERAAYACRLLRKATRQGTPSIDVTGPLELLAGLDLELWAFDPVEFIPHVLLRPGAAVGECEHATPIWLIEQPCDARRHEVLVNLGADAPVGFESYARLIEIVSAADEERVAARARWKHYASRGYALARHEVGA